MLVDRYNQQNERPLCCYKCQEVFVIRWQHNISTNIVDDDHKKDAFLACIGNETLGLLQALVVPAKLGDKTYDELVVALTAHFVHTPLINSRKIQVSQTRTKRRLGLKKLAEDCKFGETLTETCGTLNENVQKRRITKVNLTFAKALEATEITEQAAKDAKQLLRTDNPSDVHQVLQAWQADKHNKGPLIVTAMEGTINHIHAGSRKIVDSVTRKDRHIARVCRKRMSQEVKTTPRNSAVMELTHVEMKQGEMGLV
ncbi:hypothetical protein EMCRGX_G023033 [Ephydatia muelleri]